MWTPISGATRGVPIPRPHPYARRGGSVTSLQSTGVRVWVSNHTSSDKPLSLPSGFPSAAETCEPFSSLASEHCSYQLQTKSR
jgi:hypothetical protein